jgi:hypothetical protein
MAQETDDATNRAIASSFFDIAQEGGFLPTQHKQRGVRGTRRLPLSQSPAKTRTKLVGLSSLRFSTVSCTLTVYLQTLFDSSPFKIILLEERSKKRFF